MLDKEVVGALAVEKSKEAMERLAGQATMPELSLLSDTYIEALRPEVQKKGGSARAAAPGSVGALGSTTRRQEPEMYGSE